jgi:photosystem II stability/assembly factor-like uncharacterized protein
MSLYNTINVKGYMQLYDTSSPSNPPTGQGSLYKKTGNADIYWKPDAAGSEVNLVNSFNQPLNTTDNVEFTSVKILPSSVSADGTTQTAVTVGGQIYVSIDSGNTWVAKDSARDWLSVAMSSDGTKQTAVVTYGGQIYVSIDSGNTWVAKDSNRNWQSVAVSSDGTIQTAVVNGGQIYVSIDSGNTWVAKDSSRGWYSVAMSSDGTVQTAVATMGGQIYVSIDSGNTWVAKESARDWLSVAMSSDGTKQTAVVTNGLIYVSIDSGNTWVAKTSVNKFWRSVAMSLDGTVQTAVDNILIYVSIDSGNTWVAKTSVARQYYSVAMSSNGTTQTAVVYGDYIYVSTDSGNTWVAKDSVRNWRSVAMSTQTGSVQYLGLGIGEFPTANISIKTPIGHDAVIKLDTSDAQNSAIQLNNVGVNQWVVENLSNNNFSIAKADSQEVLGINQTTGAITINPSTNSTTLPTTRGVSNQVLTTDGAGASTWANTFDQLLNTNDNVEFASAQISPWTIESSNEIGSLDGTIQAAAVNNGLLYVSLDSGNTWVVKIAGDEKWRSIAMSSDGTILTAVGKNLPIYVSIDSGDTWVTKDSSRFWVSVAMSSDGTKQTAVVFSGQIYVSSDSGNTWVAKESVRSWESVVMSLDGTIQAVAGGAKMFVSSDSGNTWVQISISDRYWRSVAMSSDGTKLTSVVGGGWIFISSDSGNTWVAKLSDSGRDWRSVAMSSDGTIQTAVGNGYIFISSDSGNTWVAKDSARDWRSVAMSLDGTKQTVVVYGGQIYVSIDSGNTWVAKESVRDWTSIAVKMSTLGKLQFKKTNDLGRVLFSDGSYYYSKSENDGNGVGIVTSKSRGTISSPLAINSLDTICEQYASAHNGTGYGTASIVATKSTQPWSISQRGSEYEINVTDNGNTVPSRKLLLDTAGVTINDSTNSITFPGVRGTVGQVLNQDAVGLTSWQTPFIPYNYNYDSGVNSTNMTKADGLMTITTTTTPTSLLIEQAGTYLINFNSLFLLGGSIPQQLTKRAQDMVNELTGKTYASIATLTPIVGNNVYTPGNYKTVGAGVISNNLVCSGNGIFLFYIDGALTMAIGKGISLTNGALAENVFFVVNGAFSSANNCTWVGQLFASTAIAFPGINYITGKIISLSGAITIDNANMPTQTPDTSSLIKFDVLTNYIIYTVAGAITKSSGLPPAFTGDILTGLGVISGFGAPYDGTYSSGIVEPFVNANAALYVDDVVIPNSGRCIRSPQSSCHVQILLARATLSANQIITVKCEVLLENTSVLAENRILNANRVFVG